MERKQRALDRVLVISLFASLLWGGPALANGGLDLMEPGGKPAPAEPCNCAGGPCPDDDSEVPGVYGFSGEFYHEVEDMRVPGVGFDFVWTRKYRSRVTLQTAQGIGWDFSYCIGIQQAGPNEIWMWDGGGRLDLYCLLPDGITYARDEFSRSGQFQPDNSFLMTFADRSTMSFHPLDGSPVAGKISQMADRNGNTMQFQYDPNGRLDLVLDTLNRPFQIQYNPEGFVSSVTDFAGRSVTYDYYEDGDAGGGDGDLKSVTTPAVVDSPEFPVPPGHEFPGGKTTVYTYTTGMPDPQLNHNLLTITDPLSQVYLINEYATTTNPLDVDFDHLVRQTLGDPGDVYDFVYEPQTPGAGNNDAVVVMITNDRVGNVCEYFYNDENQLAMQRQYTGRANPDLPTIVATNRPTSPLRVGDPLLFETQWTYTIDSLPSTILHPNGNVIQFEYERDVDPLADPLSRRNLITREELPGLLGGDQPTLIEMFFYDDLGGCCGTNFVSRHVDARGNETVHEYDGSGNRTRTTHPVAGAVEDFVYDAFGRLIRHIHAADGGGVRREDVFTYYGPADGHQNGYLKEEVLDVDGFALTTTYEYNVIGACVRELDPRGNDDFWFVNQLGQKIHHFGRLVDGGTRYETITFYDANDNVVIVDTLNLDETGAIDPVNPLFTTILEYDILNEVVRLTEEVDDANVIITEFEYDANRNQTLLRKGEATNGNDPDNVVRSLYDERDLLYREVDGEGSVGQSTTQFDYDGNKNLVAESVGTDDGSPAVRSFVFDGYDRLKLETDAMGNDTAYTYDANGNLVGTRVDGELDDVAGSAGNVRLFESTQTYDALDRLIEDSELHFDLGSQAAIGDGADTTTYEYESLGLLVRTTLDDARLIVHDYDSAHRLVGITDGEGNTRSFTYDANSNIVDVIETDTSDAGNPDAVRFHHLEYDGLDRLVVGETTDGGTEFIRLEYGYDSRDNRVVEMDGRRATSGDDGNVTRHTFDGINRLIRTESFLTDDGTGTGAPAGSIIREWTWDDSSRLVAETDDSTNSTTYIYDSLGRRITTTYDDGTGTTLGYDRRGNVTSRTDANGTVVVSTFDALDRLVNNSVTAGTSVSSDTTFELYRYDGLSRVVRAEDDDSIVTRSYDSLHLDSETQNGLVVDYTYDALGRITSLLYPGGRAVTQAWNSNDNLVQVDGGAGVTIELDYLGPNRVERRGYGTVLTTDYAYDGLYRMVGMTSTRDPLGAAIVVDAHTIAWDRMNNRTGRQDVTPGTTLPLVTFEYDSMQRLVRSTRQTTTTPPADVQYGLDGVHLRTEVIGGPDAGIYTSSVTLPAPGDFQVGQYTTTPFDRRRYDDEGNLRVAVELDGSSRRRLQWDFKNRLVDVRELVSGGAAGPGAIAPGLEIRSTYAYDALDRRIVKTVDTGGATKETRFYYDGWRVIEERDGANQTASTYIYGVHVDEVLSMQRDGRDYFYVADDLFNVTALTNDSGQIVERYEYDDYGAAKVNPGPAAVGGSSENPYLFSGRRLDDETGYYHYRARQYEPRTGQFLSRDPLGFWGDPVQLGNPRSYVGNNPWSRTDPMGRDTVEEELRRVLEQKTIEAVKKGLKALIQRGLLPPGFDSYAEVLWKGARAAIKAGEGISIRRAVQIDIAGTNGKRRGVIRHNGVLYRYFVIGTGKPGLCELIIQRLELVTLRDGRRVLRWRQYRSYIVPCCNFGGRFR